MPEWTAYVRQNLRLRGFRPEREAEIIEEVARQLSDAYAEALRLGLSPKEALTAARAHITDWSALAHQLEQSQRGKQAIMTGLQNAAEDRGLRRLGRLSLFTAVQYDVLYGLRMLAKSPGFTAVAVVTLALCIGANTAIFSIINAVLLKSLPVSDPQHLVLFQWSARTKPNIHSSSSYGDCDSHFEAPNARGCSLSKPFLEDVRKLGLFSGMAEFAGAGQMAVSGKGEAHEAYAQYVSGDYFQTLGVNAAVGRLLTVNDDASGAAAVAVLHYLYWRNQFGGDPEIVGKTVHLNGLPFKVVGVAEERFAYLTPGTVRDISIPMSQRQYLRFRWKPREEDAGAWWIVTVGRLRSGVSAQSAQKQVNAVFVNESLHGAKPIFKPEAAPRLSLLPAQTALTGLRQRIAPLLYVLMLAVAIVLAIGCANIAGLQLARATARRREIAIRQALGAARSRLIRQLLTESVTLSVIGASVGMVVAFWSSRALLSFATSNVGHPLGISAGIDMRVLAFTTGAAILTGILVGLGPALGSMRVDLTPALKSGLTGGRPGRLKFGSLLVVAQVALTVVILVGAGLLVHTLQNLRNLDPGFVTQKLLTFSVDATLTGYKDQRKAQFFSDLQQRFSSIPGVLSATYSEAPLLSGSLGEINFHVRGTPPKSSTQVDYLPVGPAFFETMKLPMIKGRTFNAQEFVQASKLEANPKLQARLLSPAVVNEMFVKTYFRKVDPLGQKFGENGPSISGDPDTEETAGWIVIGVVRDAKYNSLRREIHPTMYVASGDAGAFELRTATDPESLVPAIRNVVRQAGSEIPIVHIETQSQQIDSMLFQERLIARLSSLFGLLALLLASIGLYGLLAYEVTNATREIGICVALGAPIATVLRGVIRDGVVLTAIGSVIGIVGSLASMRFLSTMLYNVAPSDPVTLIAASCSLLLVAVAACYMPARRATRVDPLVALRHE
jgi:predicted permease